MSNSILKEKWTRWYPENIFLKNTKKKQKVFFYFDQFTKEDFYIDLKNKKQDEKNHNKCKIHLKEKEGYENGFKKGLEESQEKSSFLINQLNNLFVDCENSLSALENILSSRVLTIVLRISAYVIGRNIDTDKSTLIEYIKKIIEKDGIFLKKPKIIVHSDNKALIEQTFKDFFKNYGWTVVCNDDLDLNSCKVESESSSIDATVDTRWREVCRLIDL